MAEQLEPANVGEQQSQDGRWQRRRAHRRQRSPVIQFASQHRFELLWGAVLVLGVFLVFGPPARQGRPGTGAATVGVGSGAGGSTQTPLAIWLDRVGAMVDRAATGAKDATATFMAQNNASVKLGVLLLGVALLAIPLRARWWLINRSSLRFIRCPDCGSALHRVHRTPMERLAGKVVPLRRYHCSRCHWKGLRIDGPTSIVAAAPARASRS